MSIRQVNGFGGSSMREPSPPSRQAKRWTGSTKFPTNGLIGRSFSGTRFRSAPPREPGCVPSTGLGEPWLEGYSTGRSQVSSDPSPSMWRASSSLNLAP